MTADTVAVRRILDEERPAVARLLSDRWGSTQIVSREKVHDVEAAEVLVAVRGDELVGSASFVVGDGEAELLTLDALDEGVGIGSALLEAVAEASGAAQARRLVLSTTNDNLRALDFYQRRGFRLLELLPGAVDRARERKPSIPLVGSSGIEIHDELVLVRDLDAGPGARHGA
jgi:ribosomal protein S18 acetylase RimI-like enzyme